MATVTVRGLDAEIRHRLRVRAAAHGRSMEAEIREILRVAVAPPQPTETGLGSRIHGRFIAVGGLDLDLPSRHDAPRAAVFDA